MERSLNQKHMSTRSICRHGNISDVFNILPRHIIVKYDIWKDLWTRSICLRSKNSIELFSNFPWLFIPILLDWPQILFPFQIMHQMKNFLSFWHAWCLFWIMQDQCLWKARRSFLKSKSKRAMIREQHEIQNRTNAFENRKSLIAKYATRSSRLYVIFSFDNMITCVFFFKRSRSS